MRIYLICLFIVMSCAKDQKIIKTNPLKDSGKTSESQFLSGLYTLQDNEGSLNIVHESREGFKFDLRVNSQDNKKCQISGFAQLSQSSAIYDVSNCQIWFTETGPSEIFVESECSKICSSDITLGGIFADVGDLCSLENLQQTNEEFLELFNRGSYQSAIERMEPLINKCENLFERNRILRAKIRNDMAYAAYKIGNKQKCLIILNNINSSKDLKPRTYSSYWTQEALEDIKKVSKQVDDNRSLCSK